MYRQNYRTRYFIGFFLFLTGICFIQCKRGAKLPEGDPGNGGLFLPGNFEAVVVADSIGPARHIAVNGNGDIYVKLRYSKKGEGGNVALITREVFLIACVYTMDIYIMLPNLLFTGIN